MPDGDVGRETSRRRPIAADQAAGRKGRRSKQAMEAARERLPWILAAEAVRGFLMERHLPFDQIDEWADEIETIYKEALDGRVA